MAEVCGHSACSQYFIDTGKRECVMSEEAKVKNTIDERMNELATDEAMLITKSLLSEYEEERLQGGLYLSKITLDVLKGDVPSVQEIAVLLIVLRAVLFQQREQAAMLEKITLLNEMMNEAVSVVPQTTIMEDLTIALYQQGAAIEEVQEFWSDLEKVREESESLAQIPDVAPEEEGVG